MSIGQSRKMSAVETTISVVVGYVLTVLIQYLVYPLFGISVPAREAFAISALIVLIAFVKNFTVRRVFNLLHVKSLEVRKAGLRQGEEL